MNFNRFLEKINAEIIAQHPDAILYEIHGRTVKTNDENGDGMAVTPGTEVAFGINGGALVATVVDNEGNYEVEQFASPWVEDRAITPYLPSLGLAIKAIGEREGIFFDSPMVTLRHQLFPTNIEPQYIISENGVRVFFGVWSCRTEVEKRQANRGFLKKD